MKRKLFLLMIIIVLLLALATPAAADVLWEPYENDYYATHFLSSQGQRERKWLEQFYVVPEGMTVHFYDAPEEEMPKQVLEAGTRVFVHSSIELDGTVWGIGYPAREYNNLGWFRLGRMQREYDSGDFRKDFQAQLAPYGGQLDNYQVKDKLYSWTYPGSGVLECTLTDLSTKRGGGEFQYTYTDPEGGLWGYIGYYLGHWHGDWIYLSDPENPDPPFFPQPIESTVTDTRPTEDPSVPTTDMSLMWAAVLVTGVVAVTGMLIWRMKKRMHKA